MSLILSLTEKVLTGIGERPDFAFNQHFLFKISLAIIAGLLMGIEREYKGKDVGLKTNMLVAVASCAFVIMSLHFQGGGYIDLTRVLGQVVVGVGFLGAGVILKNHGRVKGLTTAATVWCSAGSRMYGGIVYGHKPDYLYWCSPNCQCDFREVQQRD